MYHIKDDIRAYKLAELIYQGILTLLQSREFSKITISDIQRVSFVGRSTFYRSFDAPIDVLQWKCESAFKKMMEDYTQLPHHDQENNEFLCYFFGYWMTNYQILDILSQIGRYDIIYQAHLSTSHILYDYFKPKISRDDVVFSYYMAFRIGAFIVV